MRFWFLDWEREVELRERGCGGGSRESEGRRRVRSRRGEVGCLRGYLVELKTRRRKREMEWRGFEIEEEEERRWRVEFLRSARRLFLLVFQPLSPDFPRVACSRKDNNGKGKVENLC